MKAEGTLDINSLRGAIVNAQGESMTTNLPIEFQIVMTGDCPCLGDITDSTGFGLPDFQVDTGDILGPCSQTVGSWPAIRDRITIS